MLSLKYFLIFRQADFYVLLGLERDATPDQIKKAYRKVLI